MKTSTRKFIQQAFQHFAVSVVCASMILPTPLLLAQTPHIVPDGRTQTTVTSNAGGTLTDVRTNTIHGSTGYNSFERFNVPGGNTTNLYVPDSANSLVNMVRNERSFIDGTLNSYKNGQIGGNIFFMNPHGIVVGAGGVMNVGSLHMSTPTTDYMNQLLNEHGQISAVHEQMLFSGNVPINSSGTIIVKGKINAVEEVNLTAGGIDLERGSRVRAGHQVQVEFGDVVGGVEKLNWGNELIQTPDGKIQIVASNNVTVAGQVSTDAVAGENAGQIDIRAGNDINVNTGAEISARGVGANSDGGEVVIFADRNSYLQDGAVVDVSAENGKGGILEFSAIDTVNITGNGLRSSYGGTVLIDPETINWKAADAQEGAEVYTSGADFKLEGNEITLEGITISTRQVGGVNTREYHLKADSIDVSGNITIEAQTLKMINSVLLAYETEGVKAVDDKTETGKVTITLTGDAVWSFDIGPINIDVPLSPILTTFEMDKDSWITGKDVTIDLITKKSPILNFEGISTERGNEISNLLAEIFNDFAGNIVEKGNEWINEFLNGKKGENGEEDKKGVLQKLEQYVSVVVMGTSIDIHGTIIATGTVDIKSTADASAKIENSGKGLSWGVAYVQADSEINIGGTARIDAKDIKITSTAKTTIEVTEKEEDADSGIFANYDVALGLGIAQSNNTIKIVEGAVLKANNDVAISALTERSHKLSVSGGNGSSYMGLVVGVLVGNADTNVTVGGELIAGNNVTISAKTDTKDNVVSTIAEMQAKKDDDKKEGDKKEDSASEKDLKTATTGLLSNLVPGGGDTGSGDSDDSKKFGAAGAISVTVDNVDTNVTIGSNAGITATEGDVKISAETINVVMSSAFAHIGEYTEEDQKKNQDNAIALSTPIVVMNNSTSAIVKTGAEITAGGNIDLTAETRIPFNKDASDNDLYKLVNKIINYKENALKLLEAAEETTAGGLVNDLINGNKGVYDLLNAVAGGKNIADLDALLNETFAGAKETIQSMKEMIADLKDRENIGQLFGLLQEKYTSEFNGLLEELSNGTKSADAFVSAVGELADKNLTPDDIKNWVTKTSIDAVTDAVIVEDIKGLITALKDNQKNFNDLVDDLKVKKNNITEFANSTKSDIQELFKRAKDDSGINDVKAIIDALQSGDKGNYFGLTDGLLNTWGQSSTKTEEVGAAAMVTYLGINNTTIAQIEAPTVVGGKQSEFTADNLNVEAKTTVELANLVGALAAVIGNDEVKPGDGASQSDNEFSTIKGMKRKDWVDQYLKGIPKLIEDNSENKTDTKTVGGAIGGAILLTNIDSTTIARIDSGIINITKSSAEPETTGNITVRAETKAIDIGIAIGAGNSGKFGVNFMANPSFYDSYTLAKIDDTVNVNAHNVTITANDTAYRLGIAGSLTSSSALSVGISGAASIVARDAHAVWGNLLERDSNGVLRLATIKGDKYAEQEYDGEEFISTVTGNVTIKSYLNGLNLIAAVAGAETRDSMADEANAAEVERRNKLTQDAYNELQIYLSDGNVLKMRPKQNVNKVNEAKEQLANLENFRKDDTANNEGGVSGAFVISYMEENSSAGISGNVRISAGDIDIKASNSIVDIAVGGGVFVQGGDAKGGASVGGGISVNILDGNTLAYIQPKSNTDANVITYESLNISADRTGMIFSAAVGGSSRAENSKGEAQGVGVAAGITVNMLDNDTLIHIENANLKKNAGASGDLTAKATNSSGIFVLTGGLAIGGDVGIGASVAVNMLSMNTQTSIINSVINAGKLDVLAATESLIVSLALSGGIADGDVGVGGTIAFTQSSGKTVVDISGSTIDLSGDIIIAALSGTLGKTDSSYEEILGWITNEESKEYAYSKVDADKLKYWDGKDFNSDVAVWFDKEQKHTNLAGIEPETRGFLDGGKSITSEETHAYCKLVDVKKTMENGSEVTVSELRYWGGGDYDSEEPVWFSEKPKDKKFGNDDTYETLTKAGVAVINPNLASHAPRIITAAIAVGMGKNAGVGANIGVNLLSEETYVSIANNSSIISTGAASTANVHAKTEAGIIAIGAGVGVGTGGKDDNGNSTTGVGVGGNIGVNLVTGRTEVVFDNNNALSNDRVALRAVNGINVNALNSGGIVNVSLAIGGGKDVGVGAAFSWNQIKHSTAVDIRNSSIISTGGDVALDAMNTSDIVSVLLSVGAGGSTGVGASVAINAIGGITGIQNEEVEKKTYETSQLQGAQNINTGLIELITGEDITGEEGMFADSKTNPKPNARTAVNITNSNITAENGNVVIDAKSEGQIVSVAVGAGFGGGAGVGVAGAYNVLGSTVGIFGDKATITAKNGSILANSDISNSLIGVTVGGGISKTAGVGVGVMINNMRAENLIEFKNTSNIISHNGGDVILQAKTNTEARSVATSLGIGGTAGVGVVLGINLMDGKTKVDLNNSSAKSVAGSVVIDAETDNDLIAINVALAGGGTAGVGVGVMVNNVKGTAQVNLLNKANVWANNNALIHSNVDNEVFALSTSLAFGGSAGVAVGVTVNLIGGTSNITVRQSNINALASGGTIADLLGELDQNYEITIAGISKDFLNKIDPISGAISEKNPISGVVIDAHTHNELCNIFIVAAGSGTAAVAIGVPVTVIEGFTTIALTNSYVNTKDQNDATLRQRQDVAILSHSDSNSFSLVVAAAVGGTVAVGGIVDVHVLKSKTFANITGGRINAGRDIMATSTNYDKSNSIIVGVAVGGTVGAALNYSGVFAESEVKTIIDSAVLDAGNDLTISADNTTDLFSVNVGLAGGTVGLGANVSTNILEQKTLVQIIDSTLKAAETLTIEAIGTTDLYAQIHSAAGGYFAAAGAVAVDVVNSATLVEFVKNTGKENTLTGQFVYITAEDILNTKTVVGGYSAGAIAASAGVSVLNVINRAAITGIVDIEEASTLNIRADVVRDINRLSIAGSGGAVGLAATVNIINAGGFDPTKDEDLKDTWNALNDNSRGNTKVAEGLRKFTDPDDSPSITGVSLGGDWTIITGAATADVNAKVDNKVNQQALGVGAGFFAGAGAAVGKLSLNDDVTVDYKSGTLEANTINFNANITQSNLEQHVIAGAGGIVGVGAAVGVMNITGNTTTKIGSGATLEGNDIYLKAGMDVKNALLKANSVAAGGLGISAAEGRMNFYGKTLVEIASGTSTNNTQLIGTNINISAYDTFGTLEKGFKDKDGNPINGKIENYVVGAGGGVIGGGGAGSYLNIYGEYDATNKVWLPRNTSVSIGDYVFLGIDKEINGRQPTSSDSINISALSKIWELNNHSAVDMYGVAVVGVDIARSNLYLNTDITVGKSDFVTGTVSMEASEAIDQALVNAMVEVRGGFGIPTTEATLNVKANNSINLNNTYIDAWGMSEAVKLRVGHKDHGNLNAVAFLNNFTAIPVFEAPPAHVAFTKNDVANFYGTDINSVSDIVVEVGKGKYDAVGKSEAMDTYRKIAQELLNFFGANVDFTIYGGTKAINVSNLVALEDSLFEAGSHWKSWVDIDVNGNITNAPWINVVKTSDAFGERRIGDEILNQIKSLEEALGQKGVVGTLDALAYQEEIDYLKRQLKYYCTTPNPTDSQLLDRNNYPTVTVVMIVEDITAAAGDIIINAATVSASNGTRLSAHADPSITITNNSQYFLQIGDGNKDIRLTVPNPLDGGGRVLINNTLSETLAGATLDSVKLGRTGEPVITITNTQSSSEAGSSIATELILKNATLSNAGGTITLSSKGSIWQYDSVISGQDIQISTAGSYYLNSKDGIYSTGNVPYDSNTNVAKEINKWIQEQMVITGGLSKEQIDMLIADLQRQFAEGDFGYSSYSDADVDAAILNKNNQILPLQTAYLDYINSLVELYGGTSYSSYDNLINGTNGTDITGAASKRDSAARTLNDAVTNDVRSKVTNWDSVMKQENIQYVSNIDDNGDPIYTNISVWVKNGDFSYAVKTPATDTTPAVYYTESDISGFINALNQYGSSVSDYNINKGIVDAKASTGNSQEQIFALNKQVDTLNAIKNSITNLTSQRADAPEKSPGDEAAMKALLTYRDSIADLQDAVTTASWEIVFGASGTGDHDQLVSRTTGQTQTEDTSLRNLISVVYKADTGTEAKLEAALQGSALAYVKDRIKSPNDAKNANVKGLVIDAYSKTPLPYVPERESTVYGARSVFISAETLNINGTIQSGYLNTTIDLTNANVIWALNNYNSSNENTAQASSLALTMAALGITDAKDPRLAIYPIITLKDGNKIVIDPLIAYAGDITLSGNIISTGNGKVEVADGYGNFQIKGNPAYDLILNRVDAGMGAEGVVRIIDKAKGFVTEYTRTGGIQSGKEIHLDGTTHTLENGYFYEPVINRWLESVFASNTELEWSFKSYNKYNVLFGQNIKGFFDWAKDPPDSVDTNSLRASANVNKTYPVGTFLITDTTIGNGLLYGVYNRTVSRAAPQGAKYADTFVNSVSGEVYEDGKVILGAGWRKYSVTTTSSQSFTEVFKTYLNASQQINISFTGSESLSDAGVNITNARSVTLNDIVRSAGNVTINTAGNLSGDENNLIIAKDVSLTAKNIGNANQSINLEPLANGTLAVNRTGAGADTVNIYNTGEILVNSINANGADVKLVSTGNVLDNGTGIINANRIEVVVGTGRIGGRTAIDMFKMSANDNVILSASGDIDAHFTGDLHAESIISTAGNVNLYVTDNLLAENIKEIPNPLSDERKMDMWGALQDDESERRQARWDDLTSPTGGNLAAGTLWKDLSDEAILALLEGRENAEIADLLNDRIVAAAEAIYKSQEDGEGKKELEDLKKDQMNLLWLELSETARSILQAEVDALLTAKGEDAPIQSVQALWASFDDDKKIDIWVADRWNDLKADAQDQLRLEMLWATMDSAEQVQRWQADVKDNLWKDLSDAAKMNLYEEEYRTVHGAGLSPEDWDTKWRELCTYMSDNDKETLLSDTAIQSKWRDLSNDDKKRGDIWIDDGGWAFVSDANKLAGSIFFSDAGTRNDTRSTIKEPNISGINVTLDVGGAIGNNVGNPIVIKDTDILSLEGYDPVEDKIKLTKDQYDELSKTPQSDTLFETEGGYFRLLNAEEVDILTKRRALADAEWDDIKFSDGNKTMTIYRYNSVNIEVRGMYNAEGEFQPGKLQTKSGTGWTNIGSQGDIILDNEKGYGIQSGSNGDQELRLKTTGSIFASDYDRVAIFAKNAILEAAWGTLGKDENSLLILHLTGAGNPKDGWLTARGTEGVYLSFGNGTNLATAYLREVGSTQGTVHLMAASFEDAFANNEEFPELRKIAKIGGKDIVLVATMGGIGSGSSAPDNPWMRIAQAFGGSLTVDAVGDVFLYNTTDVLNVVSLIAGGNVTLDTAGNMLFMQDVFGEDAEGNKYVIDTRRANLKIVGDATFIADGDVAMDGANIDVTGIWNVIANNISVISTTVTKAGDTTLSATSGLSITGGTANLGNTLLTSSAGNISLSGWKLTTNGTFDVTAAQNLSVTNAIIGAEDTKLVAKNGNLTINDGIANLGSTKLTSEGGNVAIADWTLNGGTGELDVQADKDLLVEDSIITAGKTTLTAINGDLTIAGKNAALDKTELISGGSISLSDWELTARGAFDATAVNHLSITNAIIKAEDTTLVAERGNLTISGETANLGSTTLTSGDNLSLTGWALKSSGTLKMDATNDITVTKTNLTAGKTTLDAKNGNISLTELVANFGMFDFNAFADNVFSITDSDITAGKTTLIANDSDLTINGGTANLGNTQFTSNMGSISIADWTLNGTGMLTMDAANAVAIVGTILTAGTTTVTAQTGDLTITNGMANFGNTTFTSGNNLSLTNWTLKGSGTLDTKASNDISVTDSILTATGNASKNAGNDITVAGSTIDTGGNLSQTAGNDLSLTHSNLTTSGNLNQSAGNDVSVADSNITTSKDVNTTAGNDISIVGSNVKTSGSMTQTAGNDFAIMDSDIIAGNTKLTATNGDLSLAGTTVQLDNAWLEAGNNITILNSPKFDVKKYLDVFAEDSITLFNVVAQIGDVAGTIGLAEFNALGYHLYDWHFYVDTVMLSGIDLYNDPIYLNSLAFDRIIRITNGNVGLSSISGQNGDEDEEEDQVIKGSWLQESEEEEIQSTLHDQELNGVPVAGSSSMLAL